MFAIKTFYRDATNTLVSPWLMAPKQMLSKDFAILVFDTEKDAIKYNQRLKSRRHSSLEWSEVHEYVGTEETVKMYWQERLDRF